MWKGTVHGLLAMATVVLFSGCPRPAGAPGGGQAAGGNQAQHEHEHEHEHETGPHGGDVIVLGNEDYHAELVHDDETGDVTVYILDRELNAAVPIPQKELVLNLVVGGEPKSYALLPAPLDGDPEDMASRFSRGGDDELVEALHDATEGRFNVDIAGKNYVGQLGGHDHHHHGHDHEGDGHGHEGDAHDHEGDAHDHEGDAHDHAEEGHDEE